MEHKSGRRTGSLNGVMLDLDLDPKLLRLSLELGSPVLAFCVLGASAALRLGAE